MLPLTSYPCDKSEYITVRDDRSTLVHTENAAWWFMHNHVNYGQHTNSPWNGSHSNALKAMRKRSSTGTIM
jgi:hypothetical protein